MTAPISSSSIPAVFSIAPRQESLAAIGDALKENGKVIVTGCMGAEPEQIDASLSRRARRSPGRSNMKACVEAVHRALPPAHDPLPRSGAAARHQADAAPLRLSEDFRRLQQPLLVLHHPETARRSGVAPGRRRAARGREAGRSRRQGIAGHLAGHLRLLASISNTRPAPGSDRDVPREVFRSRAGARRTRRLGAAAIRLPLPSCRRGHSADGRGQGAALSRYPVPARKPGSPQSA